MEKKNYHVILGVLLFGIVIALFLGGWFLIDNYIDATNRGVFGDKFGAVNALFSGLAFAGLIYTIILQHDELNCQRQELADNRKEMERQTNEFKKENENLKIQRFENTFFNMLTLQQQIIDELVYKDVIKLPTKETTTDPAIPFAEKENLVKREVKGREMFRFAFEESIHDPKRNQHVGLAGAMREEGQQAYTDYYTSSYFDHYFRHFYSILKFIKQNEWMGEKEQYRYATILRATLSRYELVWLYYNGLSENGYEKLKPLLEEFSMLKNLREDLLTLCRENVRLLDEKKLSVEDLKWNKFSGTDYEFFMTDCKHPDSGHYFVQAFYNKERLEEGIAYYRHWAEYINQYGLTP